jgi:hypothetical protein
MKEEIETIYQEMMNAIAECMKATKIDMIATCFWTACKYWGKLKNITDRNFFENAANEIDFFRNIKPRFTAQIQYFTILEEVLMFLPKTALMQIEYWKEEQKRYWRFCQKHREFVNYYESLSVYLDSVYFVRVSMDWVPAHQPVSYDMDKNFCSSHDHLVRGLLAHKMYNEYVKEKLNLIKNEL